MMLAAGIQYFFPTGGVDEFTVTEIDPAADVDPTNALAFITGLTFVSDGPFTGTMTTMTMVEELRTDSIALLASGLLGLLLLRKAATARYQRRHPGGLRRRGQFSLEGRPGDGTWSISVSGNWRLTFDIRQNEICDLDLEDYH